MSTGGGGGGLGDVLGDLTDGLTGKSASDSAMKEQRYGAQRAQGSLTNARDASLGYFDPYQKAGTAALSQLQDPNFMKDFTGDPGYQFRLQQGNNAINNALSARGLANSGAALKELTNYGQNFASNEYNNAYNRAYGRLSNLAGMGMQASNQMAGAQQNYGNQMANLQTGYANQMASGQMAQANRMSGLYTQGLGLIDPMLQMGMLGGGGGGGAGAGAWATGAGGQTAASMGGGLGDLVGAGAMLA